MKNDLVSISDLTLMDVNHLFDMTRSLKDGTNAKALNGKTLVLLFEKPSLRTRVTFEAGMTQLGGHAIYLAPGDIGLGVRETVPDVAHNLERWVDGIIARTFQHETVVALAKNSTIPVVNALSDLEHPCQALADYFTILEQKKSLTDLKVAYFGDGNNVCHSLILLSSIIGTNFVAACPKGYQPKSEIVETAHKNNSKSGGTLNIVEDPNEAARDADVVYTDVWVSMGEEAEREQKLKDLKGYQVNSELLSACKDDVIVMHCLPAKRGLEITDEVMDSEHSVVFDEAENRLHVQKAILVSLITER